MNILRLTATEALSRLTAGELTAGELTGAFLDQIEARDSELGAYLEVTAEAARLAAAGIDAMPAGERPPLAGLPLAIKDALNTRGVATTSASRILKGYVPVYDATCVAQLGEAGTVTLGKTNMDEFAMGSSTESSAYGVTRNPWNPETVPGGSSGGSAAAVAAGEALWALGSDTGGSIRQPASFCGIVGMKPTYGAVSRYGLIAFASSLDQVGPMTRSVRDAALMLSHITGKDPRDSTSVALPEPVKMPEDRDLSGLKIGVIGELSGAGIDVGVREAFEAALKKLEGAGARLGEASLPHLDYALPAYYIIAPAEASANLARFDGVRFGFRAPGTEDITAMYEETRSQGFGDEVKRRIMLGTYALSSGYYDAYYGQAQKVRTLIRRDFDAAFAGFDLLVSPTTPTTAFAIGEKTADPLLMYMSDVCTIPVNLAGLPAISIPAGLSAGMPVGLQMISPAFTDNRLLQAAHGAELAIAFDEVSPFVRKRD